MGLDTVELVMALEEEFQIEISNEAAEKIVSVRDVVEFVLAETSKRGQKLDSASVFERVRSVTTKIASVRAEVITLDTRFVEDLRLD